MSHMLSLMARDALGECVNIGGAHAATSLYKLLGSSVTTTPPDVDLLTVEQVTDWLGSPEQACTVSMIHVKGDAPGMLLLTLSPYDAQKLAKTLTSHESERIIDDLDRSALNEAVNIAAGSCLSTLSSFLNISLQQSVPATATDMLGALLSPLLVMVGQEHEQVLTGRIGLNIPDIQILGSLVWLMNPIATKSVLEALNSRYPS